VYLHGEFSFQVILYHLITFIDIFQAFALTLRCAGKEEISISFLTSQLVGIYKRFPPFSADTACSTADFIV
jgi:hypothetical protein